MCPFPIICYHYFCIDDGQVLQILSGDPSYEIQSQVKIVRIFTSSTFTGESKLHCTLRLNA